MSSPGSVFDRIILSGPQNTLLTPMCAKEVYVLRTLGIRWRQLATPVARTYAELMAHPTGFGPVDFKLYATRKVTVDNVVQTVGQSIDVPKEIFEWPLLK